MTNTAETGATAPKWWAGKYSSIVGLPICAQPDPKKNSIVVCGVRGTKEEAEERAALIVRAVNRDSRFVDMVGALDEIAAKDRHFFTDSNTKYDGPYATIANRVLSSIKASTS